MGISRLPKGVTFNEKAQFCCSEKFRGFDSLREPPNITPRRIFTNK
nr:MAG TPA: hypothetical protein [Caudoviricetes sp.]